MAKQRARRKTPGHRSAVASPRHLRRPERLLPAAGSAGGFRVWSSPPWNWRWARWFRIPRSAAINYRSAPGSAWRHTASPRSWRASCVIGVPLLLVTRLRRGRRASSRALDGQAALAPSSSGSPSSSTYRAGRSSGTPVYFSTARRSPSWGSMDPCRFPLGVPAVGDRSHRRRRSIATSRWPAGSRTGSRAGAPTRNAGWFWRLAARLPACVVAALTGEGDLRLRRNCTRPAEVRLRRASATIGRAPWPTRWPISAGGRRPKPAVVAAADGDRVIRRPIIAMEQYVAGVAPGTGSSAGTS